MSLNRTAEQITYGLRRENHIGSFTIYNFLFNNQQKELKK